MAVTSGFYNSVDGDRKYNALQMSSIFDGIIEDGVYNSIGDRFSLTAGEENTVIVGTGRAWFNHSWTLNDANYPLTMDPAEVVLNRYDAIVIEVNGSAAVRNNSIKVIKGTAGSSPSKPSMANGEDEIWQHPLGYIYVPAGASSISQSNIEYVVGTSECPFVIAAVQSVDIDALVAQWSDQFNTWFDNLEIQLSGDVAGNLQNQINQKVDKANVIDNLEDLIANQASDMVAGAKAVSELNDKLKVYETNNNGIWTVVKHPNRWTELHITAIIPRASTEAYSMPLNFPDEIRLRNAQTFITPARNGWNVANYYHNNDYQDSQTTPIDHTNLVFSAKTTQSLTYYFEVMVCGFEY